MSLSGMPDRRTQVEELELPSTSAMISATWSGGSTEPSRCSTSWAVPRRSTPRENWPASSSTSSSMASSGTAPSAAAERVMVLSSAASICFSSRLASGLPMASSRAATFSAPVMARGT